MLTLLIGNSNVLELRTLVNSVTGAYDAGATVSVTLYEADGTTEVTGQSWPASLSHVVESPETGKYRVTLDSTLAVSENRLYRAVINAVGTGSEVGKWQCDVRPETRCT